MNTKILGYQALRFDKGKKNEVEDLLTVEEALSIYINSEPLTVTMQTPGNERQLTRGLLYTEGIYKGLEENFNFEILETNDLGNITKVNVTLSDSAFSILNKRTLLSVSACGICGKRELDPVEGRLASEYFFHLENLEEMFGKMYEKQRTFHSSGGCHSAAAYSKEGQMLSIMEDIGRHNAVDKVIGDLLCNGMSSSAKIMLVSGRLSYEIVAKTFMAGIPILAAVSAPSSLAVDFSKELGITLLGFCRENRATVYSHAERVHW